MMMMMMMMMMKDDGTDDYNNNNNNNNNLQPAAANTEEQYCTAEVHITGLSLVIHGKRLSAVRNTNNNKSFVGYSSLVEKDTVMLTDTNKKNVTWFWDLW
jgi:hypothetical protein